MIFGDISVIETIFLLIIMLVSLTAHEYAHAWTSYKLGDPTPVLTGRLSLNPLKHIDFIGFICLFLIGFGWAKPVIINPTYYKDQKKGEILTAFAGPAMNLVLSFFGMLIMMSYAKIVGMGLQEVMSTSDLVIFFWQLFIIMNIGLAVFNMIPVAPLDGYRLIKIFWEKGAQWMEKNVRWINLILVILIISGSSIISGYISTVTDIIYRLFLMLFSLIFY